MKMSGKKWKKKKKNRAALSFACFVRSALKMLKMSGITVTQLMELTFLR